LEFLEGNTSLHYFWGSVDVSVFNDFETEVDHSLKGGIALAVTSEWAALEESSKELLEYNELGEVLRHVLESLELSSTLRLNTIELGLYDMSRELKVGHHGLVHDWLNWHVVELLSGNSLYTHFRYKHWPMIILNYPFVDTYWCESKLNSRKDGECNKFVHFYMLNYNYNQWDSLYLYPIQK
jgi:hypothetical protein